MKQHTVEKRTTRKGYIQVRSGLRPALLTPALPDVIDLKHLHKALQTDYRLPPLEVPLPPFPSIRCLLADYMAGSNTGERKLESCSSCSCRGRRDNSEMEDAFKVNVADLDTVIGSDFFPPLSSNIGIFRGVAEIETSSGRIRTSGGRAWNRPQCEADHLDWELMTKKPRQKREGTLFWVKFG